jgi:hypothetical protein
MQPTIRLSADCSLTVAAGNFLSLISALSGAEDGLYGVLVQLVALASHFVFVLYQHLTER